MHPAQDNDVVQALAPDRSDQPFGKAILPGRGWCNWLISDAHGAKSARDNGAVDPIAVPDHITRSPIPRKCLGELACNPLGCRAPCDVDPDEISAVQPDDDEGTEQVESDPLEQRTSPWRQCLARGYARRSAIPGWAPPAV